MWKGNFDINHITKKYKKYRQKLCRVCLRNNVLFEKTIKTSQNFVIHMVWHITSILTHKDQCFPHIEETRQLTCSANQLSGFYMIRVLVLTWLNVTFLELYLLKFIKLIWKSQIVCRIAEFKFMLDFPQTLTLTENCKLDW